METIKTFYKDKEQILEVEAKLEKSFSQIYNRCDKYQVSPVNINRHIFST